MVSTPDRQGWGWAQPPPHSQEPPALPALAPAAPRGGRHTWLQEDFLAALSSRPHFCPFKTRPAPELGILAPTQLRQPRGRVGPAGPAGALGKGRSCECRSWRVGGGSVPTPGTAPPRMAGSPQQQLPTPPALAKHQVRLQFWKVSPGGGYGGTGSSPPLRAWGQGSG